MSRLRERNIDDEVVAGIVQMLDGWSGKLRWEALIGVIEQRAGLRYTRQALHRHERVRVAFTVRKKALSGHPHKLPPAASSPELQVALDRIARLEGENQRLSAENSNLLEQFARWAYNAHTRNVSKELLNNPLPAVDRARSDRPRSKKKSRDSLKS